MRLHSKPRAQFQFYTAVCQSVQPTWIVITIHVNSTTDSRTKQPQTWVHERSLDFLRVQNKKNQTRDMSVTHSCFSLLCYALSLANDNFITPLFQPIRSKNQALTCSQTTLEVHIIANNSLFERFLVPHVH